MYVGCQVFNGIPRSLSSAPGRCFELSPLLPATHTTIIDIPIRAPQPQHVTRRPPEVNVTFRDMTEAAVVYDLPSLQHDVPTCTYPVHSVHCSTGKHPWRT